MVNEKLRNNLKKANPFFKFIFIFFIYLFLCCFFSFFICLFGYMSVYLFLIYLSIWISVCLFIVYLFTFASAYLCNNPIYPNKPIVNCSGSIFFTAGYSESLNSLLTFYSLYKISKNLRFDL